MEKTTIQISQNTLNRLKALKILDRQSYDDILNNLIDNLDEETMSEEEINEIKIGLENVRKGRVKPIEKVAKEIGISLK